MHRDERCARPQLAIGDVEVPERQLVAAVADDDGSDMARGIGKGRGIRFGGSDLLLRRPLAPGVGRRD
jgi:hypothetical protein